MSSTKRNKNTARNKKDAPSYMRPQPSAKRKPTSDSAARHVRGTKSVLSQSDDVNATANATQAADLTASADVADSNAPDNAQVQAEIDELAAAPKRQRVWEVDFVRGLMILFVVWDHFMFDVDMIGGDVYKTSLFIWLHNVAQSYYASGSLRNVTHDAFVTMFVLTSGVSCSFSRNNGKRALKMVIFAALFTAVTYAISAIFGYEMTIYFNVIHVIALSVALYAFVEWAQTKCVKNWQKNIFGCTMFAVIITSLVLGYYARLHQTGSLIVIFGESEGLTNFYGTIFGGGDWLLFLPDFGWFLLGAFLGKRLYPAKQTLFPSVDPRYVCPVTFCGRYSLWVYVLSQVVMYGSIYLLHVVVQVL